MIREGLEIECCCLVLLTLSVALGLAGCMCRSIFAVPYRKLSAMPSILTVDLVIGAPASTYRLIVRCSTFQRVFQLEVDSAWGSVPLS